MGRPKSLVGKLITTFDANIRMNHGPHKRHTNVDGKVTYTKHVNDKGGIIERFHIVDQEHTK